MPDAVNEEFLAKWKQHGHGVEPRRLESAAPVPVGRERCFDIERFSARPEFEVFRAMALR
jgi:hypothetical protein